jgi:hypothetical protein
MGPARVRTTTTTSAAHGLTTDGARGNDMADQLAPKQWKPSPPQKPQSGSHSCAREKLYEQLRTAILTCASHSQLSTHPHNLPQRHPTVFCMLISPCSLAPSRLLLLLLCSALLCSFAASHAPQLHHPPPPPLNTHHFLFRV